METETMYKLTPGEEKLMIKFNLVHLKVDEKATLDVANVFSGEITKLNHLGVDLYNIIKNKEVAISTGKDKNISEFDRCRYLFAKLFPDEYMNLLD